MKDESSAQREALSPAQALGMLRVIRTSTLADILEEHDFHGAVDARVRGIVNVEKKLVGRAITMKKARYDPEAPEARLSSSHHLFELLDVAHPGDVLVIDADGAINAASFGDLAGHAARARGIAGVVCDGAIRDVSELRAVGMPVFATGVHTSSGLRRLLSLGMNVPISCGGVPVRPGDYIVGDEDGVVVVPAHLTAAIVDAFKAQQTELVETAYIEETGSFLRAKEKFGRA